jgi:hypothetical protein
MPNTTPTYRAQTDPTTKKWHLGSAERGTTSYCGVRLIDPDDTRAFAQKVQRTERQIETADDLSRVDCGACKRNREYKYATGTATRPEPRTPATARTRSRQAAATREAAANDPGSRSLTRAEAAELAAAAADEHAETNGARPPADPEPWPAPPVCTVRNCKHTRHPERAPRPEGSDAPAAPAAPAPRRRAKSRADKAHAAQEADRARRAELAASADVTVAGIDAALAAGPDAPAPVPDGTPGPALLDVALTEGMGGVERATHATTPAGHLREAEAAVRELMAASGVAVTMTAPGVVTAELRFAPGDRAAYASAEQSCVAVLARFDQTGPGSVWGTDSGSIGGQVGLREGYCRLNKSGVRRTLAKRFA